MSASSSVKQAKAHELRHRVLTCLYKLSDRDTHSAAASELESIAKKITGDSIPPFISSIAATDNADKSPVRRQCIRLISVLSEHHGNSLSPYLSKLLSAVVRRLRDTDSSVRAACVGASFSLSSSLTSSTFTSISKPFLETLFIEQESNAQTGAALCLAAIIEGSRAPDAGSLRRLLPKLEKLAKSQNFKAKAALLTLIRSVVDVKGVLVDGDKNVVRNLIILLMEFLRSEDWAARKAAAEALMKIAAVETNSLSEYKIPCLKTFEAKKFDKVKATRETFNQLIEAWKEIPDLPEDDNASPLPESEVPPQENASEEHSQPGPKPVYTVGSTTSQARRRILADSSATRKVFSSSAPASATKNRSPLRGDDNKTGRAMFQKLDRKKPMDKKVKVVSPKGSCGVAVCNSDRDVAEGEEMGNPEIKRALSGENSEKQKASLFRGGGARLVPCGDTQVVSVETGDTVSNSRESEDISLIRKQLLQIENQQSNLLNLLEGFMGSSQKTVHSLEARIHGLELALDEISLDLSVSTRESSQNAPCFGRRFLSSKLWWKAEPRSTPAGRIRGNRGIMLNPLAKDTNGE